MRRLLRLLALAVVTGAHAAPEAALTTQAERSGLRQTGRYDEVERLCHDFARTYPRAVRCFAFGRTPQGRTMWALAASQSGALTPAAARRAGLPVTLIQGGIHAGEIDGKDAGFLALRQVARRPGGGRRAGPAGACCSCRCSTSTATSASAPGTGPTSAARRKWAGAPPPRTYNLNRDYLKADSRPRCRPCCAWSATGTRWRWSTCTPPTAPSSSTTSRSMVEPLHVRRRSPAPRRPRSGATPPPPTLARPGFGLPLDLLSRRSSTERRPGFSGFEDGVSPPRFSSGYFLLRNRFGMLVETHSWKRLPRSA